MKKAWVFLLIAIVIAAQYILIASFHSATSTVFGSENSAVIVLKAKFAVARVHVHVFPHIDSQNPTVTFVFPDGSQEEVKENYSFDIFLLVQETLLEASPRQIAESESQFPMIPP
jgi:hypothetical protein